MVCNFSPTAGHEQNGLRPALVLSGLEYNTKSGLVIICPITSTVRDNYFEVKLNCKKTKGVVLSHQIKTIDYVARNAKVVDKVNVDILREVVDKVMIIIEG